MADLDTDLRSIQEVRNLAVAARTLFQKGITTVDAAIAQQTPSSHYLAVHSHRCALGSLGKPKHCNPLCGPGFRRRRELMVQSAKNLPRPSDALRAHIL